MTDKQFEQKKKELREEMNANGFGWIDGNYIKPPQEYKMREEEFHCIDMINSILAYNWFGQDAEGIMQMEERNYHNYLAKYVGLFGRNRVINLIQEQINSIKNIKRNVYEDSEGVTYNSIIWNE